MSKKEEIKRLWRECFGDSQEYADMYFSRVYPEAEALVMRSAEGRVVSSLLLYGYDMLMCGRLLPMVYLGGASTARKARGRGYMSRLVLRALDMSRDSGAVMYSLVPAHGWLSRYFERFGFADVYLADRQCYTSFHPFATESVYSEVEDCYSDEVAEMFRRYEMERKGGVVHSRRDFLNVLDDLSFRKSGTFVAVSRPGLAVAGMAWAFDRGDVILVNELLGADNDARTGALQALRRRFPDRQFTVLAPAGVRSARYLCPRGMGRLVNVGKCLTALAAAHPQWHCVIRIDDPLLEANSGIHVVEGGVCHKAATYAGKLDFDVSIDVFTRMVFSSAETGDMLGFPSERTHISLMLH